MGNIRATSRTILLAISSMLQIRVAATLLHFTLIAVPGD